MFAERLRRITLLFALRTCSKMPEANEFNVDVDILNLAIDMVRRIMLVRFL